VDFKSITSRRLKMSDKVKIASVTSEGQPQKGQKNRSSGNFSTEGLPGGFNKLYWEITGTEKPESIKFNVMRDKSAAVDPVEYEDLKDGSVTDIKKFRSLYIANPKGSYGGDFIVTVYAANY